MSDIVKICKIHGALTVNFVYTYTNKKQKTSKYCEFCREINNKKYKSENKDKILERHRLSQRKYDRKLIPTELRRIRKLKNEYNLSCESYNLMLSKQIHLCAICFQRETYIDYRTKKVKRLCVDHCHKTGKIRELICYRCNIALGKFEDSIKNIENKIHSGKSRISHTNLQSMIEYLRRHQQ